jgi:hypothetical protein
MKVKVRLTGDLNKDLSKLIELAKDKIVDKAIEALKEATPVDTGEARDGWQRDNAGNIVNDVEHVIPLNNGSSEQAPAYFIEKTLLSQVGITPSGTIVRQQ